MAKAIFSRIALLAASPLARLAALAAFSLAIGMIQPTEIIGGGLGG